MRAPGTTLIAALALALAGCFGGGHGHGEHTCPDGTVLHEEDFEGHDDEGFDIASHCPRPSTGPSPTPTAPPRPNVLPTLVLTVTDDAGNATNVTSVGGNLTFSAEGSSDPDGVLVGAALVVTDSNQTRSASLLAGGRFTPVTLNFDRAGIANVTVNLIDERAGFTVRATQAYVNEPQDLGGHDFNLGAPPVATVGCDGPVGGSNPVDPFYYKTFSFNVEAGASFVEAAIAVTNPAQAQFESILCAPDMTPISAAGTTSLASSDGVVFQESTSYYVAVLNNVPQSSAAVSAIVHYEPRAAA